VLSFPWKKARHAADEHCSGWRYSVVTVHEYSYRLYTAGLNEVVNGNDMRHWTMTMRRHVFSLRQRGDTLSTTVYLTVCLFLFYFVFFFFGSCFILSVCICVYTSVSVCLHQCR